MAPDPDAALHRAQPGKYKPGVLAPPQLLTDAYSTPPIAADAAIGADGNAAAKPLDFFDRVKLSWKEARAGPSWGLNQHNYEASAYQDLRGALEAKGYKLPPAPLLSSGDEADFYAIGYHPTRTWLAGPGAQGRFDAFWRAFDDARATDPNFVPAYKDVHDFGTLLDHVHGQRNAAMADVANRAPDGLGVAGFVGSVGAGFADPISYIPVVGLEAKGLSFGARLLAQGLKFGALNAGVTTATEPLVQRDAVGLGLDRGAKEFMTDLLTSTATGVVLGSGSEFVKLTPSAIRERSFAAAPRRFEADRFGKALNSAVGRADLPEGSPFRSFDATVARVFAEAVPPEQRTPDEQAAIHAVTRDAEVKATSPFVPGPEGDDAHGQWLDQAMHAVTSDGPPRRGGQRPIAREALATADNPSEAAAAARKPGREVLKAKIGGVEGTAKNPASGAEYKYQFVPRTWVSLFKRRYPNDTRSFDQIVALRANPQLREVLMDDLIGENAAALRHAGFDENAGNLYLAHVLGHDRAATVLRANPDARLGDLLPHNYFKGNPFKPTDTAASLIHWAYGKMGDRGFPEHVATAPEVEAGSGAIAAAEGGAGVEGPTTGRFDVEALYGDVGMTDRPVLNPELFDSAEEHAAGQIRFERERDAAEGFAPVLSRAEAFLPAEHFGGLRSYQGKVTADAIGEALGLSPSEVVKAVGAMQASDANSPFVVARAKGAPKDSEPTRVVRRPKPPGSDAPQTLVQFLKSRGGISAAHAGELVGMDAPGTLIDRRLHDAREGLRNSKYAKGKIRNAAIARAQRRFDAAEAEVKNNPRGMALDKAMEAAVEAGYFPEHLGGADTYADLPDPHDLLDAIDAELRGEPRYAVQDFDEVLARREAMRNEEPEPEETNADRAERLMQRIGHNHEAILATGHDVTFTDDMMIDASDLIDAGHEPDAAVAHAIVAQTYRDMEEMGYGAGHEFDEADDGFPEPRDGDFADPGDEPGSGRSFADASAEAESRAQLAQSAHDPEAGAFSDPVGPAAEAQADSALHDAEMLAKPADGEEPDTTSYRLDEDGEESDLAGILDEIEQAQKAAAEMRNCLKPKGGE